MGGAAGGGGAAVGGGGGSVGSGMGNGSNNPRDPPGALAIVKAQAIFLFSTLTEENFSKNQRDIDSLLDSQGSNNDLIPNFIRRLIAACAPALSTANTSTPAGSSNPASLSLRLLLDEVIRLSRDPLKSEKFAEALAGGIGEAFTSSPAPSSTAPGSADAFRNFDLDSFLKRITQRMSVGQIVTLCTAIVEVLFLSPALSPSSPALPHAVLTKRRNVALSALNILRTFLEHYSQLLAKPGARVLPPPSELGPPGLTIESSDIQPRALVGVCRVLISEDWSVLPGQEKESEVSGSLGKEKEREREFGLGSIRLFFASAEARFGLSVMNEVLGSALQKGVRFAPDTSVVTMLHRLCPHPIYCNLRLVQYVFQKWGNFPTPASVPPAAGEPQTEAEKKVAEMLFELVDYAMLIKSEVARESLAEVSAHPLEVTWVKAVDKLYPHLRWSEVILGFDNLNRTLPETFGLRLLANVLGAASAPPAGFASPLSSTSPTPPPTAAVAGLWADWANPDRQLGLIDRLLFLPTDTFNLSSLPCTRKVVTPEDAAGSSQTIRNFATGVQGSVWNNLDLIHTLVKLSEAGGALSAGEHGMAEMRNRVREVLERSVKANPELVIIALVQIQKPWSPLHNEFAARLLHMFLVGHPSHQLVFHRIWQIDRVFLIAALRDFYTENEMNVTRVLDVAQDLKILDQVLELRPFGFMLDLAALSSRREYLNLEKWLIDNVSQHGESFVRAMLEFLAHKVKYELSRLDQDPQPEPTTLSLSANIVSIFIRALRQNHEVFTQEDIDLFKDVRTQCLQLHPRLMNFAPGADHEPGMSVVNFNSDIENRVDAFYKQMYDQKVTVESVVQLLQSAKESENPTDHEFLACFLTGLFDEHRFFPTYPPRELSLTAILFGSIIQHQLIEYIPLGIAVRHVLDALRHPPESNWFMFGVQSLSQFQSRLSEWPQLASAILTIPHLPVVHPDIAAYARSALARSEGGENGLHIDGVEVIEQPAFTAIRPDEVSPDEETEMEDPEEEVSDKILFIVNNLARNNFESKVADMTSNMKVEYSKWFANYLVTQRVVMEPNNHQLYLDFLDALDLSPLNRRILHETLVKSTVLLNSEKTVQSSSERSYLKNLGSWLGSITLAKNKPIKHSNIAFKDLLIQGYDANRLMVAIPFVCKVLEQSSRSRVFKPPNPWLMGILRVLVELYKFAELKLNLKFEIEVLCKSLSIELKEIQPTTTLRSRPQRDAAPLESGPSAAVADQERLALARYAQSGMLVNEQARPAAQGLGLGSQTGYSAALQDNITAALQNLPNYITFSANVPTFANNASLKRIIHMAIDRAIREVIIAPVVERSITVGGISTRELTTKDFAMEGNEDRLRKAAHLMVQNLAGSLALVTCKDPLRISMVNHIRTLLLQNGIAEQNLPEPQIHAVASENLDLACSIIERVAMDKAVVDVDEGLGNAYMSRRRHRERSTQAFWDTAAMAASHYSGMLPDPLRLKLGGLSPQQLRVYEDFGRIRGSQIVGLGEVPRSRAQAEYDVAGLDSAPSTPYLQQGAGVGVAGLIPAEQAMEQFARNFSELERLMAAESVHSITDLPSEHDVIAILREITVLAVRSITRDATTLLFSQKVVSSLYRATSDLARDAYVTLLVRLCEMSPETAKEVVEWLLYAEDERKFNVPVTVALVAHGLLKAIELDVQLAKFISRDPRENLIDFTARFIRECLVHEPPIAIREHFLRSIEALALVVQQGAITESANQLLDDLRVNRSTEAVAATKADLQDLVAREQLGFWFAEWVRVYSQSPAVEKSFVDFVTQLQKQGILKGEEISSLFFRVCTEVGVESYIKQMAAGDVGSASIFQPVDAFAKLVVFMIKYHSDATGANNDQAKTHYLTKILSIVVLVLAQSHEDLGAHFQQKPFFRFFSSLLSNLDQIEAHLGPVYYKILVAFGNSVNTLQPTCFPAFAFSWVALITHRLFMPRVLGMKDRQGWSTFHRLMLSLLRFLAPFLRKAELRQSTYDLYQATVRIFLVLLHDFPEFLVVYHHSLCDAIPAQCVQLRNIVLCAFPAHANIPYLYDPTLDMDAAPDTAHSPTILSDYTAPIHPPELRSALDKYLQTRNGGSLLPLLKSRLIIDGAPEGERYNTPLLNGIVTYLGVVAVNQSQAQASGNLFNPQAASVSLVKEMLGELDPEGVYLLVSSFTLHLRWPNAHSHWFSRLVLNLFEDAQLDTVREIIARVLLERVVVERPHPWYLVYTFVELLRNQRYSFWAQPFVNCAPEMTQTLMQISKAIPVA